MDRQYVGLLLGFLIGSAALWPLRHRLAKFGRTAEPQPPVTATAEPAAARPGPSPKAGPSYAGSLDLFVETNRKSAQGTSDSGDVPRVREGALVAAPPKTPVEEPAPARGGAAPQAAGATLDPAPAPAERGGGLVLLRLVALGAAVLALLGTPVAAGAGGPSRALAGCGAAAAAAALLLAAGAILRGDGPEPLAWLVLSVGVLALAARRLGRA